MDKRFYNLTDMINVSDGRVNCNNCGTANNTMNDCLDTEYCNMSPEDVNSGILTMAFVDMQPIENVYQPETALSRGTLFPNIDKPFYGRGVLR